MLVVFACWYRRESKSHIVIELFDHREHPPVTSVSATRSAGGWCTGSLQHTQYPAEVVLFHCG